MRRFPITAALIALLAATPTWSESTWSGVMLPCGTERVPVQEAESIWWKDGQVFAFCTTIPGVTAIYLDPFKPEEGKTKVISELPEVYFGERLVTAGGFVYLKLLVPSDLRCEESPPGPYVLLSRMDCRFRLQAEP